MKKTLFLLTILLFLFQQCNSQPGEPEETGIWASARDINVRLGKGINIGNTYEAMQSWQSPFDPADLKRIANLVFTSLHTDAQARIVFSLGECRQHPCGFADVELMEVKF